MSLSGRWRTACLATIAGAMMGVVSGQEPGETVQTFRAGVDVAILRLTVRNPDNRLVTNLERDDFRVLVDGQPAEIVAFAVETKPLAIALMINTWMDILPYDRLRGIGYALVDALLPGDVLVVGSFAQEIAISPWLTSDRAVLRRVIGEELWGGNGNPLGTAVDVATNALSSSSQRRVVMMVGSHLPPYCFQMVGVPCTSEKDAEAKAIATGVRVYGIRLDLPGFDDNVSRAYPGFGTYFGNKRQGTVKSPDDSVLRMARDTAGGYLKLAGRAGGNDDLEAAMSAVTEELRREYVIGFKPVAADGQRHTVRVQVTTRGLTAQMKPASADEK